MREVSASTRIFSFPAILELSEPSTSRKVHPVCVGSDMPPPRKGTAPASSTKYRCTASSAGIEAIARLSTIAFVASPPYLAPAAGARTDAMSTAIFPAALILSSVLLSGFAITRALSPARRMSETGLIASPTVSQPRIFGGMNGMTFSSIQLSRAFVRAGPSFR